MALSTNDSVIFTPLALRFRINIPSASIPREVAVSEQPPSDFESGGGENLFSDFWHFLKESKKWWLVPLLVFLLLAGLFIYLCGTGAAPFIYTLF